MGLESQEHLINLITFPSSWQEGRDEFLFLCVTTIFRQFSCFCLRERKGWTCFCVTWWRGRGEFLFVYRSSTFWLCLVSAWEERSDLWFCLLYLCFSLPGDFDECANMVQAHSTSLELLLSHVRNVKTKVRISQSLLRKINRSHSAGQSHSLSRPTAPPIPPERSFESHFQTQIWKYQILYLVVCGDILNPLFFFIQKTGISFCLGYQKAQAERQSCQTIHFLLYHPSTQSSKKERRRILPFHSYPIQPLKPDCSHHRQLCHRQYHCRQEDRDLLQRYKTDGGCHLSQSLSSRPCAQLGQSMTKGTNLFSIGPLPLAIFVTRVLGIPFSHNPRNLLEWDFNSIEGKRRLC